MCKNRYQKSEQRDHELVQERGFQKYGGVEKFHFESDSEDFYVQWGYVEIEFVQEERKIYH